MPFSKILINNRVCLKLTAIYHDKIYSILQEKHKQEIIKSSLIKHYKTEELKTYQAELIKMQVHLERTGKKNDHSF